MNWCPELGTVLADEEVINGRSERGDHPVQRIPLRQWMLRITAYADRLVEDLETLDWPEPIKEMQRNWVGRSEGAEVDFFAGEPGAEYANWRAAPCRRRIPARGGSGSRSESIPPGPTLFSEQPTWCSPPSIRWSTG